MAKMETNVCYDCDNKIRNDILSLFQGEIKKISTDGGIKMKLFNLKRKDFLHLSDKNIDIIKDELYKMEKEGLVILSDFFIKITEKGKKQIFGA